MEKKKRKELLEMAAEASDSALLGLSLSNVIRDIQEGGKPIQTVCYSISTAGRLLEFALPKWKVPLRLVNAAAYMVAIVAMGKENGEKE